MKSNLLFYTRRYKKVLFIVMLISLFIYSINSIFVIYDWLEKSNDTNVEFEILQQQNNKILEEIEILKFKTGGLKEDSLNKDLLETQVKSVIDVAKTKETIIIY